MVLVVLRFLKDWLSVLPCVSLHWSNDSQAKSFSAGYLEHKTRSGVGVSTFMRKAFPRILWRLFLLCFPVTGNEP